MLRLKHGVRRRILPYALVGFAFGTLAQPVMAFDQVSWTWNKTDRMVELVEIIAFGEFYPTGVAEIEKFQVHIGDLSATATLDSFENRKPYIVQREEQTVEETTYIDLRAVVDRGRWNSAGDIVNEPQQQQQPPHSQASLCTAFNCNPSNTVAGPADVSGTVDEDSRQFAMSAEFQSAYGVIVLTFDGEYENEAGGNRQPVVPPSKATLSGALSATADMNTQNGVDQFNPNGPGGQFTISADFEDVPVTTETTVVIETEIPLTQDAVTELPHVDVVATSAANVDSIESEVMTFVHSGQFAFGDGQRGQRPPLAGVESGNRHFDVLLTLLALNAQGALDPAAIDAAASAGQILNASANVAATALTNAESISLQADEVHAPLLRDPDFDSNEAFVFPEGQPGRYPVRSDEKLVADIIQYGYSDNTATAYLGSQTLQAYTGLRLIGPVGENVSGQTVATGAVTASAIGNAANIKVGRAEIGL